MLKVQDYEFEIEGVYWYPAMALLVFTTEDDTVTVQFQSIKTEAEAQIYAGELPLVIKN